MNEECNNEIQAIYKMVLSDIDIFVNAGSGLRLRRYQRRVAKAIVKSVLKKEGKSFVIMFPRQSGKNELQAQIEAYLLILFSEEGGDIVKISPTWKPQSLNAMHRLETTLRHNFLTKDLWEKQAGYIYRIGNARVSFLSGAPETNIVGATASLLLEVDEAQDVLVSKYDREVAPMAASKNATRVFWGTAWTTETLLARELLAARSAEQESQLIGNTDDDQRAFCIDADVVAAEVPDYGAFVQEQVRRLGRQNPLIRTQFYCEELGGESGLFNDDRLAAMKGIHKPILAPAGLGMYVVMIDIAGSDETSNRKWDETGSSGLFDKEENTDKPDILMSDTQPHARSNMASRDATAITICNVRFVNEPATSEPEDNTSLSDIRMSDTRDHVRSGMMSRESTDDETQLPETEVAPTWYVLQRILWENVPLSTQFERLTSLVNDWEPEHIVVDATGIGAGIASFLIRSFGEKVIPFTFTASSKSKLGWDFLSIIDSGRWQEYGDFSQELDNRQMRLQRLFYRQLSFCRAELPGGANKMMRWGVPDGLRDPLTGEFVHDDLIISAAFSAVVDRNLGGIPSETFIIQGIDPLIDLDKGY